MIHRPPNTNEVSPGKFGAGALAVLAASMLLAGALAVSCGGSDSPAPGPDAGTTLDAGSSPDAGSPDAGTPVDAGIDAGAPEDAGVDAGSPDDAGVDAGSPDDAGVDAGSPADAGTDAGTPADAGPDAGPVAAVNGCTTFEDHSAVADARAISFTYPAYTPPCMHIAVGQTVTFTGTFSAHPLMPGIDPNDTGTSSAGNPITSTSTGPSQSFTFTAAGTYGYYCNFHYGVGMIGAIEVE